MKGEQFKKKKKKEQGFCAYPLGEKKLSPSSPMSHCFQDTHVFVFYAEIQNGHQKWWENECLKKVHITLNV